MDKINVKVAQPLPRTKYYFDSAYNFVCVQLNAPQSYKISFFFICVFPHSIGLAFIWLQIFHAGFMHLWFCCGFAGSQLTTRRHELEMELRKREIHIDIYCNSWSQCMFMNNNYSSGHANYECIIYVHGIPQNASRKINGWVQIGC